MQPWRFIHHISHRRVVLCLVAVALAVGASLSLAGCGGEEEASQATAEPTMTTAPQAEPTPQPTPTVQGERARGYQGQRGIYAAFPPADLDLYRALLPPQFDMPDQPLVAMFVIDYYDVYYPAEPPLTIPVRPYLEGGLWLSCQYRGRPGGYIVTLPVDDEGSNAGGRFLGFPKYVADEITLEEQEGGWLGRVVHEGRTVMEIAFTATGEPVTGSSGGEGTALFLLVPPGEGPQVNEVKSVPSSERQTVTTLGSATVGADAGEPWAGLLDPEGATIWASFEEVTGYWWLEPVRLE